MSKIIALVVAAGRGTRLGGDLPKQYQELGGRPLLRHALAQFAAHPQVAAIRVVLHPDDRTHYDRAARDLGLLDPVSGAESRQASVLRGLESLVPEAPDFVLIHDGARPFPDAGLIRRVIDGLGDTPAIIPALPVFDTLKRIDGTVVGATVAREGLYRAQTPQGFRFLDILAAHRAVVGQELTDDAAVAERAGIPVRFVLGSEDNVKITRTEDLERARRLLSTANGSGGDFRVGTGFDVHRFTTGAGVWLCGVFVDHDAGLEGHSDADVGLHALVDAILGAIGAGDIGHHFPPSDARWKGASSDRFLRHAGNLVQALGGGIVNLDVTLICERPKVGPQRGRMRQRVAEILEIAEDRVNIKATTTEGLGFTGRREGIAAQAVATVRLPSSG